MFSRLQTCILSIFPNNFILCNFCTSFILSKDIRLQKGWNILFAKQLEAKIAERTEKGRTSAYCMMSIVTYATKKNSDRREEQRKAVN